MRVPEVRAIDQRDTVRLISTAYTDSPSTVLHQLGLPLEAIADLAELDGATNERIAAEQGNRLGISIRELVFGVPEAIIINASFAHAGEGGRFHDTRRGAWYAAFDELTAVEEVRFHRRRALRNTRASGRYVFPFRPFLADFAGEFHSLDPEATAFLAAEPVPACYRDSQALARTLIDSGSAGIVYPSVRHRGGWAIACFRPALVFHVRRGDIVRVVIEM